MCCGSIAYVMRAIARGPGRVMVTALFFIEGYLLMSLGGILAFEAFLLAASVILSAKR